MERGRVHACFHRNAYLLVTTFFSFVVVPSLPSLFTEPVGGGGGCHGLGRAGTEWGLPEGGGRGDNTNTHQHVRLMVVGEGVGG